MNGTPKVKLHFWSRTSRENFPDFPNSGGCREGKLDFPIFIHTPACIFGSMNNLYHIPICLHDMKLLSRTWVRASGTEPTHAGWFFGAGEGINIVMCLRSNSKFFKDFIYLLLFSHGEGKGRSRLRIYRARQWKNATESPPWSTWKLKVRNIKKSSSGSSASKSELSSFSSVSFLLSPAGNHAAGQANFALLFLCFALFSSDTLTSVWLPDMLRSAKGNRVGDVIKY